ncbi:uncharacterized protein BJ171DRAFT_495170 [Polychytrium aggregatum]|uniref:uncharacterized protein n=1 Tax=Polychytrium aggregatum TaxID=110093 RepID=UPI0022FE6FCD|nr:uncharacterized protein BJ171DRAFT_495170 [Polychytrium aggregatum]KAI9206925.1 hypothetical protein BJ171DRAFT_495170 [Polychytrium aggregatum]
MPPFSSPNPFTASPIPASQMATRRPGSSVRPKEKRLPEYLLSTPLASRTLFQPGLRSTETDPQRREPLFMHIPASSLMPKPPKVGSDSPTSLHSSEDDEKEPYASKTQSGLRAPSLPFPTAAQRQRRTHVVSTKADLAPDNLRLPTSWNTKDKGAGLNIENSNMRAIYRGAGRDDKDAAAVRSNRGVPPQCGIFYYEVEIISHGRAGIISIGVSYKDNSQLTKPVGYESNAWGYHGDDGKLFSGQHPQGKPFGPTFTTGDVVGCIVNFYTKSLAFTKNGVFLGIAYRDIAKFMTHKLYPTVAMASEGEVIEANFGKRPFKFDIQGYFESERQHLFESIRTVPLPTCTPKSNLPAAKTYASVVANTPASSEPPSPQTLRTSATLDVGQLVAEYLAHHCYFDTLKALPRPASTLDVTHQIRFDIRSAIVGHEPSKAIDLCQHHFSKLFDTEPHLLFQLQCLHYIELFRRLYPNDRTVCSFFKCEAKGGEEDSSMPDASICEDMEIDGSDGISGISGMHSLESDGSFDEHSARSRSKGKMRIDVDEDRSYGWMELLQFGQQLQVQYGDIELASGSTGEQVQDALDEIHGLLAYTAPYSSPVGYLLADSVAERTADLVNRAILEYQGKSSQSSLERLLRHTSVIVDDALPNENEGISAFLYGQWD